jgi:hypothetical protein
MKELDGASDILGKISPRLQRRGWGGNSSPSIFTVCFIFFGFVLHFSCDITPLSHSSDSGGGPSLRGRNSVDLEARDSFLVCLDGRGFVGKCSIAFARLFVIRDARYVKILALARNESTD